VVRRAQNGYTFIELRRHRIRFMARKWTHCSFNSIPRRILVYTLVLKSIRVYAIRSHISKYDSLAFTWKIQKVWLLGLKGYFTIFRVVVYCKAHSRALKFSVSNTKVNNSVKYLRFKLQIAFSQNWKFRVVAEQQSSTLRTSRTTKSETSTTTYILEA